MNLVRRAIGASAAVLVGMTASCAPKPNLRTAIYEEFGPEYAVMKPAVGMPPRNTPAFFDNSYRYVPGHVTIPRIGNPRDDYRRQAAVWRINEAIEDCPPSGKLYNLSHLVGIPRFPVYIEYIRDSRNLFIPRISHDPREIKLDLNLRDNDLRYVSRIRIEISNIVSYSASEERLNVALRDIMSKSRCRFAFARRRDAVQVDSILLGDVKVEIDLLQGASSRIADVLKAKIFRSVTRHIDGRAVFFAIRARPIGPTRPPLTMQRVALNLSLDPEVRSGH